jgi:predicted ester cyclase
MNDIGERSILERRRLHELLCALAEGGAQSARRALASLYSEQAEWRGSHPLNELQGVEAIAAVVWEPLLAAFPDLERRDLIFAGGVTDGREYIAAMGHYCGTFKLDWLSIPANGKTLYLRYGEVHQIAAGRIVQSTVLIDLLDVMRQAGIWPVAPSLGVEEMWPAPLTGDGLIFHEHDAHQSAASLTQTLAMHKTLGDYNDLEGRGREGLLAMPQKQHWHPRMMWYGPAGIGTTRGLSGFVDGHQLPFRKAFPNRHGGHHYLRIGDGPYSVTGGWPSVLAKHLGGSFMGLSPTGRDVTMRVMDFYLHHEGLIRENWVPIDVIHLLLQMDVDVFGRMKMLSRRHG